MKVTNIDKGPRGIRNAAGEIVMIEPGQSADIAELAAGEDEGEWFEFGDAKPVALPRSKADLIKVAEAEGVEIDDDMTAADIKAAIELHREG